MQAAFFVVNFMLGINPDICNCGRVFSFIWTHLYSTRPTLVPKGLHNATIEAQETNQPLHNATKECPASVLNN